MICLTSPNRVAARLARYWLIAIMALLLAPFAYCQVAGGTLSGTITDPSGAVVPGASVAITDTSTGITRTLTTDNAGFYSAPNLLPSKYQVTVSAAGFATTVGDNVVVSVGVQQVVNIALHVGKSSEKVEVTGAAETVQTSSSTLDAVIGATTVRELPLNGRDWTQLATLEPGVVSVQTQSSTNSATTNRGNRGFGNQLTDSGHSPYENSYRVNGINTNDYSNGAPGSVIGVNLGVDAIQEFSVMTTDYTAEYGRTSGAVINAITKSGTNQFHGTAYGFLRSSQFDAKNYFDNPDTGIPPFHRNQFGIAGGGPIKKDKTFIFADYEGIFQDQSATFRDNVPSAAALNGTLCSIPIASGPNQCSTTQLPYIPGKTTPGGVSLAVVPYFGFWPKGNGPLSANGDTQIYTYPGLLHLSENYATVRIDQHFSSKDSLDGSWFYDHAPQTQPDPLGNVLDQLLAYRQTYGAEETHISSPSFVNTLRVGFNRSIGVVNASVEALNPIADDPSLGSLPGRNAPIISVPGLTANASFGSASFNHHVLNSFQYYDDAFWTHGAHQIKFGFSAERQQYNHEVQQAYTGNFAFGSLQQFLQDSPTSLLILGPNSSEVGTRQTLFGAYIQDDWRVKSYLTVNLGIRYEPTTLPTEAHDRFEVLSTLTSPTLTPVNTLWPHNQTLRNFEPRVGFSWDPFHTGKTAVRAAFGIFDVLPINWMYTFSTGASAPFALPEKASNLQPGDFPIVTSTTIGPADGQVRYMQTNPPASYMMNWNFNIQQEINRNLILTVGYVGSHGIHLPDTPDDVNYSLPTLTGAGYMWPCAPKDANGNCTQTGGLLNPNVGPIRPTFWNNTSWYDGLQVGLTQHMSHGIQMQASYNWGKCLDTGSNPALSDPFINSLPDYMYFASSLRRGLCDYNVGQSLSVSYIWNIPAPSSNAFESHVLGGWQLGGILRAQTGAPFTMLIAGDPLGRNAGDTGVDFPNLLPNCNPINGSVNNYVNLNCFTPPTAPASYASLCNINQFSGASQAAPAGTVYCGNLFGNAGRNQLVGPGLLDFDLSIFKNIPFPQFGDRFLVQFRVEMFNVLNHPNFLPPLDNNYIFNANGSTVSGAGAIDSTSTTSRQIQFGLKVLW
jgi:hypothetical protein